MTDITIGEAIVGLLEAYGVDTIFGIPGVHNIEMYRALPRSKINHILPRHEQGAGFMADGYARAAGRPGICFTITGPGLTNILTPMGQAWSDSSPVFVISTALDVKDSAQGRGRLHEMRNQFAAAESVTALAMRAYTSEDVQDAIARAFAHFSSARPRPAYLEIPIDVLSQPAGPGWKPQVLPGKPQVSAQDIDEAVALLKSAKNPSLILGGGAMGCGEAAIQIAETIKAPILTTTAGKGTVPAAHPRVWGYRLGYPAMQELLQKCGLILAVGTELSETDFWNGSFRINAPIIRIDIDPNALASPHKATLPILGDASTTLSAIAKALTASGKKADLSTETLGKGEMGPLPPPYTDDPFRRQLEKILTVIRQTLPAETIIASDMTQIAYAANEIFSVSHPRTWLHPVGFGTLGFALPAAIGAKIAKPSKPVAALAGDYGLQYTINELGTAVELKLPIPILLWNNNALGQIRDNMVGAGIQPNAVTLRNPDFQALAKAYGAKTEKPSNLRELAIAISNALKAEGPTIIEMTAQMLNG